LRSWRPHYSPATPLPSRKRHQDAENKRPAKRLHRSADTLSDKSMSSPPISQSRTVCLFMCFPFISPRSFRRESEARPLYFLLTSLTRASRTRTGKARPIYPDS
jgi:hypothetical protein